MMIEWPNVKNCATSALKSRQRTDNFFQAPNVIGDPGFHSRGDTKGSMNPAKIVVHKVEGNRVLVISIFFEKPFVRRVKRRFPKVS